MPRDRGASWLWLFPASYLAHVVEEGFAGEGFHRWIARFTGAPLSTRWFWALNAVYWCGMVAAVRTAERSDGRSWLVPALGTITAVNGVGHLAGSVVTHSYSPGLATGLTLWTPLAWPPSGIVAMF